MRPLKIKEIVLHFSFISAVCCSHLVSGCFMFHAARKEMPFPPRVWPWGCKDSPFTNNLHHFVWNWCFIQQRSVQSFVRMKLKTVVFFYSGDTAILSFAVHEIALRGKKGIAFLWGQQELGLLLSLFFSLSFHLFSHTLSLSLYFWIFSQTVSALCVDINIIHIPESAKPVKVIDLAD